MASETCFIPNRKDHIEKILGFKNRMKWLGFHHVQNSSILFGFWQLLLHIIALGMIAIAIFNPQFYNGTNVKKLNGNIPVTDAVKRYLCGNSYIFEIKFSVWITMTGISTLATIMMLFGTVFRKPKCIVPFFCIQWVDVFITAASVIGFLIFDSAKSDLYPLTSIPVPIRGIFECVGIDVKDFVILILSVALIFKMYMMFLVWRCFTYLVVWDKLTKEDRCLIVNRDGKLIGNMRIPPPPYRSLVSNEPVKEVNPPRYSTLELNATPEDTNNSG